MTPLLFIIGVLATYRISLLATKESGPGHIFKRLRQVPPKHSAVHEWLSCIFCFSVTASLLICVLFWATDMDQPIGLWILDWLSFSAGAILMNQYFTKGSL